MGTILPFKIKQKALNIPPSLKLSGISFFLSASLCKQDRFHLIMCPPDTLKTFCQCIINILATHFCFDCLGAFPKFEKHGCEDLLVKFAVLILVAKLQT